MCLKNTARLTRLQKHHVGKKHPNLIGIICGSIAEQQNVFQDRIKYPVKNENEKRERYNLPGGRQKCKLLFF